MKRLLPAFLLLGLTSCPQPAPPVINVPSDVEVLNGKWQGTLTLFANGVSVLGEDVVYRLVTDSPETGRYDYSLLVQRLSTGEVLKSLPLQVRPDAMAYRAAKGGTPARLLLYRQVTLSDGVKRNTIEELDPLTLEVKDTWSYEAKAPMTLTSPSVFNADATIFAAEDGRLMNTVTRTPLPLHEKVLAQMANPPQPNGKLYWSPQMTWLTTETYVPALLGGEYRYDFISNSTGQKISGAPLHAVGCNRRGTQASWSSSIVNLPGGGVALSFPDGVVELRNADQSLRQAVHMGECGFYRFVTTGEILELVSPTGKTVAVRVSDGKLQSVPASPLPDLPALKVTLDTQARFLTETTYESIGTATVNGQPYSFKATANGSFLKFKAQTSQIQPLVFWKGELRRADGTLYAKAFGQHGVNYAAQSVNLKLEGLTTGFDYRGRLTR